ncbi:PAS domain S-box-containing protein [Panacagrimonas perspica]|uniref:histidine kinase n=1 Tax=Panacagrimonas perspica TaxID=381431 RepID=A0A4R7NYH2_9GAMM|nr:ATP-binding protein [Panacagrimonas perspica]TDU25580.1 PAS domain S-box-containing protein [Panacagrimonas perspica]
MTTARYLWIGFGTLVALLFLSSSVIAQRVRTMDSAVREMADARNLSAAATQLESDALRYALNVRAYLQTGDTRSLMEMELAAHAGDHHLSEYQRLAHGDGRYAITPKFLPAWQELEALGQTLVALPPGAPTLARSQQLLNLRFELQDLLAGGLQAEALSVYNKRKDDALRDVQTIIHVAWALLVGGTIIALSTSLFIASAIVRAERRLWDHRELLDVTLNSIGDGVIASDTMDRVTYINRVAESLTGWTRHEAEGQPLSSVVKVFDGADQPSTEATGIENTPSRFLVDRSGREFPVDDRSAPIHDKDGHTVGAVMICRDNTERYRLESELRRHLADVAQIDRRKSEFLAMLSHELRNPIAPVQNALQILRHRIAEAPALQPVIAMMERQIGQLVRLIDDLVDLSRISRGKIDLRLEPTDLVAVLQLAVEAVTPLLDGMDHDLAVKLPSEPVMVLGDAARLAQIVGNLLNNAAKFTDRRGRVLLTVEADSAWVVIRVSDSGIGISERQLPYVFDLYMQDDCSLQRSGSGIGLGLALVKNLVDLHGGAVTAQSSGLGKGSEFTVRLPRHHAATVAVSQGIASADSVPVPRRILVVDDNRDAASSLAILLELEGHETRTAADGETALLTIESWRPEVVFLDIGMPRLSGYDVARMIRAKEWGNTILLIALTGWGQEDDRRATAEAGFDAHLVKPATRDGLAASLTARRLPPTTSAIEST